MASPTFRAARVASAKLLLSIYAKQVGHNDNGTLGSAEYRELLANKDVNAILICTPDHQ